MEIPKSDLSKWRKRARIVAYFDLIWANLMLVKFVYLLTVLVTDVADVHGDEIEGQMEKKTIPTKLLFVYMLITWILTAIGAIFLTAEMWAAIMLLKATKQGENNHNLALSRAGFWRTVWTCFLIWIVSKCVYGVDSFLFATPDLLFRGILLYVVCSFISALEQANQTPSDESPPDNVVLKS